MEFTEKEKKFLKSIEECRVATSHNGIPHVKPVSFILEGDSILIATDYDTRMYKNLLDNSRVAATIDMYKPGDHKAVLVQGRAEIIEKGADFDSIYKKFYEKFAWVRAEPWGQKEAPFIKIKPTNKVSWGL